MLSDLLNIQKGVTSIIGGGGKTTLIHTLANELKNKGKVIITTSTHIFKSDEFENVLTNASVNLSYIGEQMNKHTCICVGELCENGKLKAPKIELSDLCTVADFVLVEADGSKGLPLKAHLDFEPVIPVCSNQVIAVVGVDAVDNKICDVVHRWEKVKSIFSCNMDTDVTEKMIADLLNTECLHTKVLINKCDTKNLKRTAEIISKYIKTECVISSLLKGEWYAYSN